MAPKFNIQTAEKPELKERVAQLTTALIKQKEVIVKLRETESSLAGDNEKLTRQLRNVSEEGEMARVMRTELQSEVARLQQAVELAKCDASIREGVEGGGRGGWSEGDDVRLKDAEGKILELRAELARQHGENEAMSEEIASLKGMLEGREGGGEGGGGGGEGREMELIEALAAAKREVGVRDGVVERLTAELEQARAVSERSESRESGIKEQVASLQAAYQQARKYIVDLEGWKEEKIKEVEALQAGARQGGEDAEEMSRKDEQIASLKARVDKLAGSLTEMASNLSRAEEQAAGARRERDANVATHRGVVGELEQKLRGAALREKKYGEREAQTARELETMRASLAQTQKDVERFKEEKEEQFRTDKMIIRQLQSETRSRTTELEAQLLEAQSIVAAKTKQVAQLEASVARLKGGVDSGGGTPMATGGDAGAGFVALPSSSSSVGGGGASLEITPIGAGLGASMQGDADGAPPGGGDALGVEVQLLVEDALVAVEDLLEALSLDERRTKQLDIEMVALENRLASTSVEKPLWNLERQVRALCGLARIASDQLQRDHRMSVRGLVQSASGRSTGTDGEGISRLIQVMGAVQGAISQVPGLFGRCFPGSGGSGARGSSEYSRVLNPDDE